MLVFDLRPLWIHHDLLLMDAPNLRGFQQLPWRVPSFRNSRRELSSRLLSLFSLADSPLLLPQAANGLTHLIITLSFSFFSLHLGRHLSTNHFPSLRPLSSPLLTHPRLTKTTTILLPLLLYLALLLICILDNKTDRTLLLSVLLAPPGTLLRFHLTRLNPTFASRPTQPLSLFRKKGVATLGTFTANMLATAVLGTSYVLQRKPLAGGALSILQCQVLQAIEDGFCGSLSTVSTFVVEIDDMRGRRGVGYMAGSWVVGILITVAIVGGSWWNGSGFGEACSL